MKLALFLKTVPSRTVHYTSIIGGIVLIILIIFTSISVFGREINGLAHWEFLKENFPQFSQWIINTGVESFNGDYEILEAGVAFAIFSFLPICQFYGGHATVDIFTNKLPFRIRKMIISFWEIILTTLIIIITWQLYNGLEAKYKYQETTFMLQFPVWWAYGASFISACIASLIAIYCACARMVELTTNTNILPKQEAEH